MVQLQVGSALWDSDEYVYFYHLFVELTKLEVIVTRAKQQLAGLTSNTAARFQRCY